MQEPIINKIILKALFGFLFIGGVVAVLNLYHAARHVESSFENVMEEYDGDIFV